MASRLGSSTRTVWNRRSSAASFSMWRRYSSRVVAPMQWSSPRASAGLSRFEASIGPAVAPAPTTVWSSSTNRMTFPSESETAESTDLSRSSNSPRNFAPATRAPRSSAATRCSRSPSGTSPFRMRTASPSATAVFPTPGSPRSTGLFFARRERIWITRRISSSRPITGSRRSSAASAVRSRQYRSSGARVASGSGVVTREEPRVSRTAASRGSRSTPLSRRRGAAAERRSVSARSRCSTLT